MHVSRADAANFQPMVLAARALPMAHTSAPPLQVPDELTRYIIQQSGISCSRSTGEETNKEKAALDERTLRFFSLAGQKFLSDLIDEACVVQQNRMQEPAKFKQEEGYNTK